jgi:hypothetical protein
MMNDKNIFVLKYSANLKQFILNIQIVLNKNENINTF